MPEIEAIVDGEGGKRVTITIAELNEALEPPPISPGNDPNEFVIYNGKYKLTITIAE
jgi:hypothetical protein